MGREIRLRRSIRGALHRAALPIFPSILTLFSLSSLLAYLFLIALPLARAYSGAHAAYYTAAVLLAHSSGDIGPIYEDAWFRAQIPRAGSFTNSDVFNIQPPTMSLILLPLVWLPPSTAQVVGAVIRLLLLPLGLMLLARTLRLSSIWGIWALPVCLLASPLHSEFRLGQVYLLLLFLLCLFFWAMERGLGSGRESSAGDWVAGAALGTAFILKSAFVWLWPLLLLGGRGKALFRGAVWAALLGLVSLPWVGVGVWQDYLHRLGQGVENRLHVTAYQTVVSLFGHLLTYDAYWTPAPVAHAPLLGRVLALGVMLTALILSLRWGRLADARHEVRMLTLALYTAPIVANAPVAGNHHYLLVLPAMLVACWWGWRRRPGRLAWEILALAALLIFAPLPYQSWRFDAGWLALCAYPRVYGAYLLWAWLGWALRQTRYKQKESL
jgi:hypothetical protein